MDPQAPRILVNVFEPPHTKVPEQLYTDVWVALNSPNPSSPTQAELRFVTLGHQLKAAKRLGFFLPHQGVGGFLQKLSAHPCFFTIEELVAFFDATKAETVADDVRAWALQTYGRQIPARAAVAPAPWPDEPELPDDAPEGEACVVCAARRKTALVKPCNHLCLCVTCAATAPLTTCPMCRAPITGIVRVY